MRKVEGGYLREAMNDAPIYCMCCPEKKRYLLEHDSGAIIFVCPSTDLALIDRAPQEQYSVLTHGVRKPQGRGITRLPPDVGEGVGEEIRYDN